MVKTIGYMEDQLRKLIESEEDGCNYKLVENGDRVCIEMYDPAGELLGRMQ